MRVCIAIVHVHNKLWKAGGTMLKIPPPFTTSLGLLPLVGRWPRCGSMLRTHVDIVTAGGESPRVGRIDNHGGYASQIARDIFERERESVRLVDEHRRSRGSEHQKQSCIDVA